MALHRELRGLGYDGGYSILKSYPSPRRRRQPDATMRFETVPGEQVQVDWGSLAHLGQDGEKRRIWAFVMTLGWSPGLLRGTGTAGGYHRLRPVSRQRLRVPGRRAPGAASTTTPR